MRTGTVKCTACRAGEKLLQKIRTRLKKTDRTIPETCVPSETTLRGEGEKWSGLSESNRHLNLGKSAGNGVSTTYEVLSEALSSI
jgi:hypothetical protein